MARPTKRTPETEKRILDALSAGNTRTASAAYAGVDLHTLTRWEKSFADFADAIKKAEASCEVRNVAIIQQAANESWTAAAWWLERRRSKDWGKKETLNLGNADDKPFRLAWPRGNGATPDSGDAAAAPGADDGS